MLKLTIITINLNNKTGLHKTIESVVSQKTDFPFEYIIIDGASNDGSRELIERYSPNITYWVSETDKGIYNAMNKGIIKASGEYCLFLNSGDWLFDSNVLNKVFALKFSEDIVYCDYNDPRKKSKSVSNEKLSFEKFFNYTPICHQATFIKHSLFQLIGLYNEKNKYASDWEFFIIALARFNVTYKHLPIILSNYDITGISSQSNNYNEMIKERMSIMKKEFPFFYDDYIELAKERNYHKTIENRTFIRRIKDLILFLIKNPEFHR